MNLQNGRVLAGDAHLTQSVMDILTTPIGSRVMRPDYGSLLIELIDQPFNALTRIRCFAAIATALAKWEPRLTLKKIAINPVANQPGAFIADIEGDRVDPLGRTAFTRLTLPLRARSAPAVP